MIDSNCSPNAKLMISETTSLLLLLRPNNSFGRFHTASVRRDQVEPVASPAMSAMPPKAEVNSEH
jgi:hypothetical protein